MPLAAENLLTRISPESTTTVIPGMVSDVSAMDVASITLLFRLLPDCGLTA